MIKKYKKKPVEIEAIKFTGENAIEVSFFMSGGGNLDGLILDGLISEDKINENNISDGIKIMTLEGVVLARPGDYIIKGIKGEFYPCKPDIFDATYIEV